MAAPEDLRREYDNAPLDLDDLHADPFVQFDRWFGEARGAGIHLPDALTLATADDEGRPNARIVVLRGVEDGAFLFYTSYGSVKGRELDANPHAALVFFWNTLERQVRARGRVERLSRARSEAYFARRPRGSQVAAWASPQSRPLPDRAMLEERAREVEQRFGGDPIPAPPDWGGFRLAADEIEFWQGRPSRLHDRFLYRRDAKGSWKKTRLAP